MKFMANRNITLFGCVVPRRLVKAIIDHRWVGIDRISRYSVLKNVENYT